MSRGRENLINLKEEGGTEGSQIGVGHSIAFVKIFHLSTVRRQVLGHI